MFGIPFEIVYYDPKETLSILIKKYPFIDEDTQYEFLNMLFDYIGKNNMPKIQAHHLLKYFKLWIDNKRQPLSELHVNKPRGLFWIAKDNDGPFGAYEYMDYDANRMRRIASEVPDWDNVSLSSFLDGLTNVDLPSSLIKMTKDDFKKQYANYLVTYNRNDPDQDYDNPIDYCDLEEMKVNSPIKKIFYYKTIKDPDTDEDYTYMDCNIDYIFNLLNKRYTGVHPRMVRKFISEVYSKLSYGSGGGKPLEQKFLDFNIPQLFQYFDQYVLHAGLSSKVKSSLDEAIEDDVKRGAEAKAIINYIHQQIDNYKENNNVIKYFPNRNEIEIKYKNLLILLSAKNQGDVDALYSIERNALEVYNVNIQYDGSKLSADFEDKVVLHELIHYFDIKKKYKGDPNNISKKMWKNYEKRGMVGYMNDPLEFNAHFFEYFLPTALKYIQEDQDFMQNTSFTEFFNNISKSDDYISFKQHLDPKFVKKLHKRLAALYGILKKSPDTLKDLTTVNIQNVRQERKKHTLFNKLMDKLADY